MGWSCGAALLWGDGALGGDTGGCQRQGPPCSGGAGAGGVTLAAGRGGGAGRWPGGPMAVPPAPQQQQEALAARRQQELEQQRQRERQELEQQRLEQLQSLRPKDRGRDSEQGGPGGSEMWGRGAGGVGFRVLGGYSGAGGSVGLCCPPDPPTPCPPGAIASTEVKLKLQEFLLSKTKEPGPAPSNHSLPQHPKCW